MSVQSTIENKLAQGLNVLHLVLENESHMHSGPASESHFKLTLVSDDFEGKRAVQRHQAIYGLLGEELNGPVHALALHLYTASEWSDRGEASPLSPKCMGGSKR